jgi:hypothetical protein
MTDNRTSKSVCNYKPWKEINGVCVKRNTTDTEPSTSIIQSRYSDSTLNTKKLFSGFLSRSKVLFSGFYQEVRYFMAWWLLYTIFLNPSNNLWTESDYKLSFALERELQNFVINFTHRYQLQSNREYLKPNYIYLLNMWKWIIQMQLQHYMYLMSLCSLGRSSILYEVFHGFP